jgi:hypothetical protein
MEQTSAAMIVNRIGSMLSELSTSASFDKKDIETCSDAPSADLKVAWIVRRLLILLVSGELRWIFDASCR